MAWWSALPHWFIVLVIVVVAIFLLKSLIKIALIVGAVGLVIYLVWLFGVAKAALAWPGLP